jgi:hypothetical protein
VDGVGSGDFVGNLGSSGVVASVGSSVMTIVGAPVAAFIWTLVDAIVVGSRIG